MGIRGLTTYIQNRSHLYMENYELHDTKLVIDGNAVACQLYKWHTSSNDCFGGDYDKFGKVIQDFFDLLAQCNVTPYVIFDGGYETRKVATVVSRMRNKIKSTNHLNPFTESSVSVFPLFLKKTFEDIVTKQNIRKVRCDFEGDTDTANIARALHCPILSYDSDYFIFDTPYIPFTTFEMAVRKAKGAKGKTYKFISCKVYRVEKFLRSFEGLQQKSLPFLAVLLGNDYVKRSVFAMFYQNLKIQKCSSVQSDQQKRIKSLLMWLQNETIESALKTVLSRYKKEKRKNIMNKIEQAIKGYNSLNSRYLQYLNVVPNFTDKKHIDIDITSIQNLNDDEDTSALTEELESCEENTSSDEDTISTDEIENKVADNIPEKFLEKFRNCIYPPSFMDIYGQNKYYCIPQVENSVLEHSHKISVDILGAIHKILTDGAKPLLCIGRKGDEHVGKYQVPACTISLPMYEEIDTISEDVARDFIFKILDIENNFEQCLMNFPKSWHIFLLSIYYFSKQTSSGWPIIYSLLLCKLILSYIDKQVGFHRNIKIFNKKYGTYPPDHSKISLKVNDVQSSLENISQCDSIQCLKTFIPYFQLDYKMPTNPKAFDRNLVHSISQFQSSLLHIGHLNTLFDFPYSNFFLPDCLNCTFIYNLTTNLNKRTNLDEYLAILLKDSPSVLECFNFVVNTLRNYINFDMTPKVTIKKRKKKKKKTIELDYEIQDNMSDSGGEAIFDPNNKFAVLSCC